VEGVDRPGGRGAESRYYGADWVGLEEGFQLHEVDAVGIVDGDGDEGDAEDSADAGVGVVGLRGGCDGFPGRGEAGYPEGFGVGDGATAGEVAEALFREAEHRSEER